MMPNFDDQELALARVYSDSMLELAGERGEADQLRAELADLAAFLDRDVELDAFFTSPVVNADSRRASIETLLRGRYSDLLVDSLQVMNRNNRLFLIRAVAQTFRLAHEESQGRVEAEVRTATPLTEPLRTKLRDMLARRTGKQVEIVATVDESLIGGMVVQIGDEKLDTSVARRLKTVGRSLLDRASNEIHSGRTYVVGSAGS